jgi:O-antigen/teichoic acid export membrane protein
MLAAIRNTLRKTNNVTRSTYVWNSVNATLSAVQSMLVIMVISRTNGVYDAGVFSLAYAVANLMLFIGQYGIRRFQASDVEEQHGFPVYSGTRVITCGAMLLASLAYCAYGVFLRGYPASKTAIVMLLCVVKIVQAYADVLHGRLQQLGRLDVAAKASAARIAVSTVIYIAMLIVTHDLLVSTAVFVAVAILVFFATSVNAFHGVESIRPSFDMTEIKALMITAFPLFIIAFLNSYISNAAKYAIDAYMSDEAQGYFGYIFMPAFAMQLLSNFIYNPILTSYAKLWSEREIPKFRKAIMRQIIAVVFITLLGLGVAATIGIPILSLLFGTDLSDYKAELCVIMLGGGMLAYATFFTTVLTIIREQRKMLLPFIAVSLVCFFGGKFFVSNYGLMGASAMFAISMALLSVMFYGIMTVRIGKAAKEKSEITESAQL